MTGRRPAVSRRLLALVVGLVAVLGPVAPAQAAQLWTKNLFVSSAFLYQDPWGSACTAASTMIMLNTIAYRHAGGDAFRWTPYRVKNNTTNRYDYRDMTSVLYFSRAHDTLSLRGGGSDPHGWRNALNYYGWGSAAMTQPVLAVYQDLQFSTYDRAAHAAVAAIARFGMPVGIVTWAGQHAQVMTGYVVVGEDPTISDNFSVQAVFLSDPLYKNHTVNLKLSNWGFKAGTLRTRFQAYREGDSPYDDGYTAGWKRSAVAVAVGPSEWYRKWVIVAPIRGWLTPVQPPPDPTPTPLPPPSGSPGATPDPSAAASAAPAAEPSTASSGAPPAGPSIEPSAAPSVHPAASPSPSP